jgi:hypothetical protein
MCVVSGCSRRALAQFGRRHSPQNARANPPDTRPRTPTQTTPSNHHHHHGPLLKTKPRHIQTHTHTQTTHLTTTTTPKKTPKHTRNSYIIPTPVVEHFITDFDRHGAYTGFPCLGVEWQKLENPDMREALKMKVRVCFCDG